MALHFRPAKETNGARHTYSRDCVCGPRVTIQRDELIVEHQSDIPWSWAAVVAREV